MGWKASCIFASQLHEPKLLNSPSHDPAMALRIAACLPLKAEPTEETTLELGMHPDDLTIGAYGQSLIIGHHELSNTCFDGNVPPVIHGINEILPNCHSLAISLHSVVNLYGYALFDGLNLVRARAGSADDGEFLDIGEWVEEEQQLFAKSELRNGERVFFDEIDGEIEEHDHSSYGEEFVFELSKRYFGERLDCIDFWDLKMETFKPIKTSIIGRLFGR